MNDHGFMRLYRLDGEPTDDNAPILFVAATAGMKGDRIDLGSGIPWDYSRGIEGDLGPRYPFLWVHDLAGRNLPLGVADVLTATDELPMLVAVTFDPADDLAMRVRAKYMSRVGGLAGISVSWDDVGEDGIPVRATGKKVAARELLEISAVPVGLDPDALKDGARTELVEHLRALEAALEGLSGEMLDAARAAERPDPSEHASDGKPYDVIMGKVKGEDAMTEQVYRYPTDDWTADEAREHCKSHDGASFEESSGEDEERAVKDEKVMGDTTTGGPSHDDARTNDAGDDEMSDEDLWRACATVMVDVFDRGCDDPDERRRRLYNAMLPTYRRLRKEPPEWVGGDELRALDDDNWRALFLAGELEAAGQRVGAELSSRNIQDLTEAVGAIQDGVDRITSLLDRVRKGRPPADDTAKDEGDDEDGDEKRRAALDEVSPWLDSCLATGEEADHDAAD